jgi:hypothetical protein
VAPQRPTKYAQRFDGEPSGILSCDCNVETGFFAFLWLLSLRKSLSRKVSYFSYGAPGFVHSDPHKHCENLTSLQATDVSWVADSYRQPSTAIYNNVNPTLSAILSLSFPRFIPSSLAPTSPERPRSPKPDFGVVVGLRNSLHRFRNAWNPRKLAPKFGRNLGAKLPSRRG